MKGNELVVIGHPAGSESPPGFNPNLSWSHYRALMRVENSAARPLPTEEELQRELQRERAVIENQMESEI